MAKRGLTDLAIRNLKPSETRREIPDHGGLYVVVQPSGKRGYCVRYRFNGTPRKLTLPSGITLAQARKLCADAMFSVAQGIDPSEAKKSVAAKAAAAARTHCKPSAPSIRSVMARTCALPMCAPVILSGSYIRR